MILNETYLLVQISWGAILSLTSFLPKDTRDIWRESANTSRLFDAYINVESQDSQKSSLLLLLLLLHLSSFLWKSSWRLWWWVGTAWLWKITHHYHPWTIIHFLLELLEIPDFLAWKKPTATRADRQWYVLMLREKNWRCKNPPPPPTFWFFTTHNTLSLLWIKGEGGFDSGWVIIGGNYKKVNLLALNWLETCPGIVPTWIWSICPSGSEQRKHCSDLEKILSGNLRPISQCLPITQV